MDIKTRLRTGIWRSDIYFQLAKEGSMDMKHPGMVALKRLSKSAKKILDLGCGEGTRLNLLLHEGQDGIGVDSSQKAISLGRKKYKQVRFIESDLESIPLKSNTFDLVYSAYVLEHLADPEKVLTEALRLVSIEGYLVLVAPNYGAPNRASPPFKGSRIKKFLAGLFNDLISPLLKQDLKWHKVNPIATKENCHSDWDTVVEPYLGSLVNYINSLGFKIDYYSSCWTEELPDVKIAQRLFRKLGELNIYPFNLWGPHLVLVVRKI